MPLFRSAFREAWAQALVSFEAAEQEAQRIVAGLADLAGFSPDDVRRYARDLAETLRLQRRELERSIDDAATRVRAAVRPLPPREEIEGLERRLDALDARIEALRRRRGEEQNPH